MAEEKLIDNETLNELRTRFEKILVPENGYAAAMDDTVLPYLQKRRTDRQLTVAPGKELHLVRYSAWPDVKDGSVKGTVIIVHGFTESAEKYREFAYYLLNFGYDVVLYDQRGHGLSCRDVEDMQLTHIDKFETYVSDLGAVVGSELPRSRKPCYLFAHSMGGAVAAFYLENGSGAPFEKAVLSSPMIAPELGGFPLWFSKALLGTLIAFGQKKKRLFLSKPPEGRESAKDASTNCEARFEFYQDLKQSRPEYSNNGPSYGWTMESVKVTKQLLKKGRPESILIPVQLWVADMDNMVVKDDIVKIAERIPLGTLERAVNCRHEIYYGPDVILRDYVPRVLEFFSK